MQQLELIPQEPIEQPATREIDRLADQLSLEELRAKYDSLCFKTVSAVWINHKWTVGLRCERCGQEVPKVFRTWDKKSD